MMFLKHKILSNLYSTSKIGSLLLYLKCLYASRLAGAEPWGAASPGYLDSREASAPQTFSPPLLPREVQNARRPDIDTEK